MHGTSESVTHHQRYPGCVVAKDSHHQRRFVTHLSHGLLTCVFLGSLVAGQGLPGRPRLRRPIQKQGALEVEVLRVPHRFASAARAHCMPCLKVRHLHSDALLQSNDFEYDACTSTFKCAMKKSLMICACFHNRIHMA